MSFTSPRSLTMRRLHKCSNAPRRCMESHVRALPHELCSSGRSAMPASCGRAAWRIRRCPQQSAPRCHAATASITASASPVRSQYHRRRTLPALTSLRIHTTLVALPSPPFTCTEAGTGSLSAEPSLRKSSARCAHNRQCTYLHRCG